MYDLSALEEFSGDVLSASANPKMVKERKVEAWGKTNCSIKRKEIYKRHISSSSYLGFSPRPVPLREVTHFR